ncbi:MAG: hypothetical protein HW414_538, partial [Dehalococcoidia bacterium]|nr:hypothetical protein [Dehalococcoidia bacterium]
APAAPAPSGTAAPEKSAAERPAPAPQLTREQQLVEAAKKEGEVVFWFHQFPDTEKAMKPFTERYPFIKVKTWDSRGTEVLARLVEEAKAGRHSADVLILSSEIVDAHSFGLLTEYEFPNVVGWTNQPNHNFYKAVTGVARMAAVFNTDLVPPADVPKSWDDIKSTKWAGKTFVTTSGEDTPLFWAYLWREKDVLNWDKSFAFWGDFIRNTRPRVTSGYTGPLQRLAAGEVALFPAAGFGPTYRLQAVGAPLGFAPVGPVTGDIGGIALLKDAPHPNAARLLIDWLTSPEGILAYVDSTYNFALDPKLAARARSNALFKSLGIAYDPMPRGVITPENLKKSSDFWLKALGVRG